MAIFVILLGYTAFFAPLYYFLWRLDQNHKKRR